MSQTQQIFSKLVPSNALASTGTALYSLGITTFQSSWLVSPVLIWGMDAPHGRFHSKNSRAWYANIHGNYGWIVMEIVSPLTFVATLLTPPLLSAATWDSIIKPHLSAFGELPLPNRILAALFVIHYAHRAVISPLTSPTRSPMHISVPLSAVFFNLINGFLMGSWLGGRSPAFAAPTEAIKKVAKASVASLWNRKTTAAAPVIASSFPGPGLIPASAIRSPLFWIGIAGWAIGFAGNVYHDELLANLRRKPKKEATQAVAKQSSSNGKGVDVKSRYKVPHGGLFEYISFPNYLSEWFEWASFAFAALYFLPIFQSSSLVPTASTSLQTFKVLLQAPPFLFLLAEVAAMLPRAYKGHLWYRQTFGDELPAKRKAVIPFIF
ncbi:hypothetical protein OC845_005772 [Tilletia horrida]|nr:hypothetical protein OC845_005772 [Tilletia horrida]